MAWRRERGQREKRQINKGKREEWEEKGKKVRKGIPRGR
jgi:hypothetical protein